MSRSPRCSRAWVYLLLRRRSSEARSTAFFSTPMRKAGFRHAGISTDWDNYRAQLFYTNFGYRLRDRTFAFERDLTSVEIAEG